MAKTILPIMLYVLCLNSVFAYDSDFIIFPKAEFINENTTRIPFKLVDHLIVVEAQLLNKKGNFIVDTGSETLILNKVHFPSKYVIRKRNVEVSGVIREIDNPTLRTIENLTISDFNILDKDSDIIDLSHIEKSKKIHLLGIIGYSILKDYEVFIDMYLQQITLTKIDKFGNKRNTKVYAEKITDSIDFYLKNHTIVLNGYVDNQKLRLGLDTASEFNQINKNVNKKVLKYFKPTQQISLVGASNNKITVLAGKLHRVKLSETIYFGPMHTVLTNLNKMNEAFGTKLDGILGYEFFAQKRTIINYKKEKLYFIDNPIIKQ